jgi:hypothetical protein
VAADGIPVTPPRPSGTRMNTPTTKIAELRIAISVSRWVLYSGAKVAHTSHAQDDQPRMNSHTNTSLSPPHGPVKVACTWPECQSPVR